MNILLVDIENCPSVLWNINKFLVKYDQIVICYSSCRTKISFEAIHSFLNAYLIGKLQIVYVNKNKQKNKNAADHAISFVAGKISNDPSTTKVTICSGDSDLDSTVNMLRSNGFTSERISLTSEQVDNNNSDPSLDLESNKRKTSRVKKTRKNSMRHM